MLEISNYKVYDLEESIIASSYAMLTNMDDVEYRVKNLKFWLSFGDFLPKFIDFTNKQNKNIGLNTKQSCIKCGSNKNVQRVFSGKGGGNYFCSKHCHELYRYGEIKDHVIYSIIDKNVAKIEVTGDKNITRISYINTVDLPLIFGKNIQVDANGYLKVDDCLFHRMLASQLGYCFEEIDHIDRNTSNNIRENLRTCFKKENLLNKGKIKKGIIDGEENIIGVSYRKDKKKWRAYITIDGNVFNLGSFEKKEDAIKKRLEKEAELFGEFSPNIDYFKKYNIATPSISHFKDGGDFDLELAIKDFNRIVNLARSPQGSGHRNAMKGIRVSFDLKYPNYISPQLQRYGFVDIVSSNSKMHKLVNMDMDACFNKYVCVGAKEMMKELIAQCKIDPCYKTFMRVLSNCPQGVELFMRCSTNYEQLATIYRQRKNHRLSEDWGAFCKWIESLPYAQELIICE